MSIDERRDSMKIKWAIPVLFIIFIATVVVYRHNLDQTTAAGLYSDGQLHMEIQSLQSDAKVMKETAIQLSINRLPENPVTDADIELTLTMPDMLCGVIPTTVVETKPGVYIATGVPVMKGDWQAEAVLQWEGRPVKVSTVFKAR